MMSIMTDKADDKLVVIPVLTLKSGAYKHKTQASKDAKSKFKSGMFRDEACSPSSGIYPNLCKIFHSDGEATSSESIPECSVLYDPSTPTKFSFKVPLNNGQEDIAKNAAFTLLECKNISGVNLKVTTKYGWESMNCVMLVECIQPITAYTRHLLNRNELINGMEGVKQESCMVKSTFDIAVIEQLKNLLQSVKLAQLRERRILLDRMTNGEKDLVLPTKMQEGLPHWVNYIPSKWYSCTVRKVIEYTLMLYTILTLVWAIWQLYKHVGFIQRHLRPILEFIEFYIAVLKDWFRFLDKFTDELSKWWWNYMKPVYLLCATLYGSLATMFKPLRNVAGIIGGVFGPVVRLVQTTMTSLRPLFLPVMTCFKNLYNVAQNLSGSACVLVGRLYGSIVSIVRLITSSTLVRLFIEKLQELGVAHFLHNLVHGGLDPFRAQFVVIRDLLIKSMKQIYYGGKFIAKQVYLTFLFWKREQQYHREEVAPNDDNRLKAE